jgi:hypothetical protein
VKRLLAIASCVTAALCAAQPAAAAEVHVAPAPTPRFPCCDYGGVYTPLDPAVYYTAAPGERNNLMVRGHIGPSGYYEITVHDDGAAISPGHRCVAIDEHTARCNAVTNVQHVEASLGDGDDQLHPGPPQLNFAPPSVTAFGGSGDDDLQGDDWRDELFGGGGTDTLGGGGENDVLSDGDPSGGDDRDVLDGGGGGIDMVSYAQRTEPVDIDLAAGTAGEDELRDIDGAIGGSGDDRLAGTINRNDLRGGQGDDELIGLGGDDLLHGGFGTDRLDAGYGDDILDPGPGTDSIHCGRGDNRVLGPGPGEVIARCDVIVFPLGGSPFNALELSPDPLAVTRRHADFDLPCPAHEGDMGQHPPCAGKLLLREAFGRRRPLGPPVRITADRRSDQVRVHLNSLGRRLIRPRRGVLATISLHGDARQTIPQPLPNVAWSIRLRR